MFTRTLLIAVLCGSAATAFAETAYVTDSLRLGIHAAEDTSDTAFENLLSGTAVEVLERKTSYARVKLADGREGWVRAAFLVTAKPAALRVAELETRITSLETELAAAKAERPAPVPAPAPAPAPAAAAATSAAPAALPAAAPTPEAVEPRPAVAAESAAAIESTIYRLQSDNRRYEQQLDSYRRSVPLWWAVAAVVVTLVASFAGALWWIDQRIRRRHGGFRIY